MKILYFWLIFFQISFSQVNSPEIFRMRNLISQNQFDGLKSNSIGDIIQQEDTLLWLATGSGLSLLKDSVSFVKDSIGIFTLDSSIISSAPSKNFFGAVSALAVDKKSLLAAFPSSNYSSVYPVCSSNPNSIQIGNN